LLCISKAVFEKLTAAAQEFFSNESAPKIIPAQAAGIKSPPKAPVPALHVSEENKHSWYTPTKIWATRYSELWQWQRVSEWWRRYRQEEFINEKRHIIL